MLSWKFNKICKNYFKIYFYCAFRAESNGVISFAVGFFLTELLNLKVGYKKSF
jgi:hypothetical protein